MSTKIHAQEVDALGNPTGFHLTPGQAHDLVGADALLPGLEADALLTDKAYDADEWVIEPLRDAGIEPVIPSKANSKEPRPYDKDLYKARSLIEIFFCKLKQFQSHRHALRQNGPKFPRRCPSRCSPRLAQLMTGPSASEKGRLRWRKNSTT